MNNEDRITKHDKEDTVKIDWESVHKIYENIQNELSKSDFIIIDCLTAFCLLTIEHAYQGKIGKPQFFAIMSQFWEEMDKNRE